MHAWLAGSRQQVQTITGLLLFVLCLSTKTFKKLQYSTLVEVKMNLRFWKSFGQNCSSLSQAATFPKP